jgi:ATP dependent DNA ligase domain
MGRGPRVFVLAPLAGKWYSSFPVERFFLPISGRPTINKHANWVYQIKWDGFWALLYSDNDGFLLVSRKGYTFKSFPGLCEGLAPDLRGRRCVLDGEIVCLDSYGKPQFRNLLFRHAEPLFYAFDLLWDEHAWVDDQQERRRFRNGEDVRYLPLIDRKLRLRVVVPKPGERLLYCDHIDGDGEGLFRLACEAHQPFEQQGFCYPNRTGKSTPNPRANNQTAGAGVPTGRTRRCSRAACRESRSSHRVKRRSNRRNTNAVVAP